MSSLLKGIALNLQFNKIFEIYEKYFRNCLLLPIILFKFATNILITLQNRFSMKKPLLFLFVSCLALGATAAPRDRAEALRLAQKAASQQGATISTAASAKAFGISSSTIAPYYIFNKDNNQGFVIVSGDDRMPDVLGYTDSGSYNEATAPDGLKFILKAFAKTNDALQKGNKDVEKRIAAVKIRKAPVSAKIDALLQTKWSQYSPFNAYCPSITAGDATTFGGHAAAGCVPISLAQVMKYYEWPKTLKAEIPAYTTQTQKYSIEAVPAGTAYDWSKMQNTYSGMGSLNAMKACGTLLANIGQALQADYNDQNDGETGADFDADPLINYFDYDADLISQQYASNYDITGWQQLIINELKAKRPVPYEAYSSDGDGHAWVVDGVDTDGKFHVNWGWAGTDDGWFFIDAMIGDDITWNVDADAVIGMTPNNGVADANPLYSVLRLTVPDSEDYPDNQPSFTVDGDREMDDDNFTGTVRYVLTNESREKDFNGYVALGIATDGGIEIISDKQQVSCAKRTRRRSYVNVDLKYNYSFKEGSTTIVYPMVSYDGENWLPVPGSQSYAFELTATETSLTGAWDVSSVSIAPTNGSTEGFTINNPITVDVTITNSSAVKTIAAHYLYIGWLNDDTGDDGEITYDPSDPGWLSVPALGPGQSKTFTVSFTPKTVGSYYVYTESENTGDYTYSKRISVTDPTGINEINTDAKSVDNTWYSVDGKRLSAKPSHRGLYIHNGKKLTVKE